MAKLYNDIEDDLFTPGVPGKLFLILAGVKPGLVKNIPYEARLQRLIGGWLFFIFAAMLIGQGYLFFALKITFSSFLLGIALSGMVLIMCIIFLRYVNSSAYNKVAAAILMSLLVILCWILLVPASLSYQKEEIKRGIGQYRVLQNEGIWEKFSKDSANVYKSDDSSSIRKALSEPIRRRASLVETYLTTKTDSINLLTRMADSLRVKYSLNVTVTRSLNDSIRRIQKQVDILEGQRADKWNQLQTITDSIGYLEMIYSKNPKDETYQGLKKYLQDREQKVRKEIYLLRNASKTARIPLTKFAANLQEYLKPGNRMGQDYRQITNSLFKLAESKADTEGELNRLNDSLILINKSDKIDQQITLLKNKRDSLLSKTGTQPVNWLTVYRATSLLNRTDPDFKSKFILVSLLWAFPVALLFIIAVFRNNYYRKVYHEYTAIQKKRTETKARSFIDIEELKYNNIDLDERLSELKVRDSNLFELEKMTGPDKPEEYYFLTASKQLELVKQTKNTSRYDPEILENGISNINKAISIVPDRSEFWELKSKLLFLNEQVQESQQAAEKFRELRSGELFRDNIDKKIWLDEIALEGLPFFGSFSWRLNPGINILLGRNGYGKSHFLSIICAMLKNDYNQSEKLSRINDKKTDERFIKLYLTGGFNINNELVRKRGEEIKELQVLIKAQANQENEKNTSRVIAGYKESIRKKKMEIEVEEGMIMLTPSDLVSGKGQIPVLAIPDMRFVNKAKEYTDSNVSDLLKGDEYLKNASWHFINQEPFESVLQNLLNILGISFFENGKSFDCYIFRVVSDVFRELTGNSFNWGDCESDSNGSYRITVLTEGSTIPLAIQKISQGTFSILSMVGLIYTFLKKKYPGVGDAELVKRQGIVVIDEIDAHLHPVWQQKIVGIIRRIFENCQFVITAHSPMIVAGCKEEEVAVMRDERDESNNITGFMIYQFREDFIGTPAETLYSKIFEVEEKDQQYLRYTAMQPFIQEMREEKETLENKKKEGSLSETGAGRLKQLSDDLYYADKIKEKQEGKYSASMLESENTALKVTIESLKQKMAEDEKK